MKNTILLGAVMLSAAAGYAQESRQDVSISGLGLVGPTVRGNGVTLESSKTGGLLLSYRYLLTPHSALELNYSFAQNTNYYNVNGQTVNSIGGGPLFIPIHTRQQELSAAYVFGLTFKRYNPFVEAGIGAVVFTPIQEGSASLDAKQSTKIGAEFGGGLAYEISPSFDVRLQYHGLFVKAPSFVPERFSTNRYEILSMPAIGVAYHF